MIEIIHTAPNGMCREGLSLLPTVRIGVTDQFSDVVEQTALNQTLAGDDPRVVMAVWVLNDTTVGMCDIMRNYLQNGGTSIFALDSNWRMMVEEINLSDPYDIIVDHQAATGKTPFGLLAHTDGEVGGLVISPDQTVTYQSAMHTGRRAYLCIDEEHPLIEAPKGPRDAMLAMLPWRDEGLFHRAVITGQDRIVARASFIDRAVERCAAA